MEQTLGNGIIEETLKNMNSKQLLQLLDCMDATTFETSREELITVVGSFDDHYIFDGIKKLQRKENRKNKKCRMC